VADLDWSPAQKYAGLFVFEVVFWFLVLGLGFWLGFPGNGLFVGVLAVLNIIIGLAGYYVTREGGEFSRFQTATKQQLSDEQARELAEYMVVYKYGYRVARKEGGIDPAVSSSDDKEDATRLYKFEFEPLNLAGRATLFIDLEQELSVDTDDLDSLEETADKVQNKGIVKSWMNEEYGKACKEKKESLGRSVDPTITLTRTENGREIRQMPAGVENQGKSNNDSAGAES